MPESLSGASAKHLTAPVAPVKPLSTLLLRLSGACALFIASWFIATTLVSLEPFKPLPEGGRLALVALAMIFSYYLYVHLLEKRTCEELHWRDLSSHFLPGFLLATLIVSLVVFVLFLLDCAQLQVTTTPWRSFLILCELCLFVLLEEIVCRSLLLRLVEQVCGSWLALLISASIYGALHSFNQGANWYSAVMMMLGQGICLGAAYLRTRNLSLCFGLHLGWNVIQGGIFSIPVSGVLYQGWFAARLSGPSWLSGASFGIEVALPTVLLSILLSAVFLYQVKQRGLLRS